MDKTTRAVMAAAQGKLHDSSLELWRKRQGGEEAGGNQWNKAVQLLTAAKLDDLPLSLRIEQTLIVPRPSRPR